MKLPPVKKVDITVGGRTTERAQGRILFLVLVCFLLGLAVGVLLYYRVIVHRSAANAGAAGSALTEGTKAVLKTLDTPVEIRFYSLLDPATTSDALRAFAGRVDQLLSGYEREAGGKITVARHTTLSDSDATAASADGVKAFNRDKGDACFLGLAIVCKDRKETLGQLSPEWEAALESDLSRAIARVSAAKSSTPPPTADAGQSEVAAIREVKRSITNLASVSVEEGTKILRQAALEDLKSATKEMEEQIKAAQQRLSDAQHSQSEAEQQAAIKDLQNAQAKQTEKLKEIAARLQEQIAALQKLKKE
jgi:hypothetical protein